MEDTGGYTGLEEPVDVIERPTAAVRYEEEGEDYGTYGYGSVNEADFGLEVCVRLVEEIRKGECDSEAGRERSQQGMATRSQGGQRDRTNILGGNIDQSTSSVGHVAKPRTR